MSSTTSGLIANLNSGVWWINAISPPVEIALGTLGNLLNIIIFTRPTLRTNPCSLYFLAGSINNFFVMYVILLFRYLVQPWNIDPSATNGAWCKIRLILTYASLCLIVWFIVLASIDRFLSSSQNARLRQMSSLSIARKMIIFTTIFVFLIHTHMLVFYDSHQINGVFRCGNVSSDYSTFFNFFFLIVSCILPIMLMCIFGTLVIFNVRSIRNRVAPQGDNARNERLRSQDRQMLIMLLIQVLITTLLTAPEAIFLAYVAIGLNILKISLSTTGYTIANFLNNLFTFLYYGNCFVGFFIYTLAGAKFRVELKRCLQYGLKVALTTTGLIRCLPLRAQEALLRENQMGNDNQSMTLNRRGNTVHPIQHEKPMIMTTAV